MTQYLTGTVDVTNGDATVIGNGTAFTAEVSVGDIFVRRGDTVSYLVGSITSDTELELTGNYLGVTGAGVDYVISRDFTTNFGFPLIERNDVEVDNILKRAIEQIDTRLFGATGEDIIIDPSAARNLSAGDRGKTIVFTNASAIAVVAPQTSTEALTAGFACRLVRAGAGSVTVTREGSDTIANTVDGASDISFTITAEGVVTLYKEIAGSPNTYRAYGDVAA